MRILKYLLLLLFLFAIGLVVFISTQNSDYNISSSKIIKTTPSSAYNFVTNYDNWQDFAGWNENSISFSNTKSKLEWKGSSTGNITTLSSKNNTTIVQKMLYNEAESSVNWMFKPVKNGTEVTISAKGKMDLIQKLSQFFKGQSSSSLEGIFQRTLVNLDKNLDYERNTFSIKYNGITSINKTFYIGKTINCDTDKVQKNAAILIKEMINFFDKNNIKGKGNPFIIYNSNDGKRVNFSACMPLRDSVYISPNSDVFASKIDSTRVVKATVTGDYAHLKKAKDSLYSFIYKNKIKQSLIAKPFDVYVKTNSDTRKPSQWVTEINIPIYTKPKPIVKKPKPAVVSVVNENAVQ